MNVGDLMSREVVTIHKDRKLSDALGLMEKNRVSRLIVVNNDRPAGIVTERDILDTLGSGKYCTTLPSSLHVSTAMTDGLITIGKKGSLEEAAELMVERGIRSLPVVNSELEGIVTVTDLLRPLTGASLPVEEIMRKPVIIVAPSERAVHARRLILDNGVGRLVVIEGSAIVGILTQAQLGMAMAAFKKTADTYQANRVRNLLVEDVMEQNVVTIGEDSSCGEAAQIMLERGFSGLPVERDGTLRGIVTKKDLITLLIR